MSRRKRAQIERQIRFDGRGYVIPSSVGMGYAYRVFGWLFGVARPQMQELHNL